MILDITPQQLEAVCREVYEPTGYKHAPAQVLLDHYAGDTTFLRVSFPERFTSGAACKLDSLRSKLRRRYNPDAKIVFCVYFDMIDVMEMARHSLAIGAR